jgi:hypothetical protein
MIRPRRRQCDVDLNGVERIDLTVSAAPIQSPLGGTDINEINVTRAAVLAAFGRRQADSVAVNGSNRGLIVRHGWRNSR